MFIASTAFLPSSFGMYCTMVAIAGWLENRNMVAIFATALGAIVGWPFTAALGIFIALDIIVRKQQLMLFCVTSVISFLIISVPMLYIDSSLYGRFVYAPLNIIKYNIFGEGGPDLYGQEPWTFYFLNGFLNFNIVFLLALVAWPLIEIKLLLDSRSRKTDKANSVGVWMRLTVLPMVLWMVIFFTRPHKEERFLFPIYPLICLSASLCLVVLADMVPMVVSLLRLPSAVSLVCRALVKWCPVLACVTGLCLSVSRMAALHYGYQAPVNLYSQLYSQKVFGMTANLMKEVNVCVGKEWYRYPSSFFLPDKQVEPHRARWYLRFVRSDFHGQLPKLYIETPDATSVIPSHMNDRNKEEPTRYFGVGNCHFMVDLDVPHTSSLEYSYAKTTETWEPVAEARFLDAKNSHFLYRAFYIPYLSPKYTSYARYVLLRNKNIHFSKQWPKTSSDA